MPLAEDTGLIVPLGLWVLQVACTQLNTWQNESLTRELTLAVNVSAKQFRRPDFVAQVQRILVETGASPTLLKIELTESTVLENVDLSPFLAGTGVSRGQRMDSASQLLAGPNAQGKVGDYLLQNEQIRVVVQAEGRAFGPLPYGGTIIDADLAGAGPGNDQFGELGLLYNFGRTLKPDQYELLSDGADGGSAIVAISGDDTANDYLSIRNKLAESLGRVPYADPYVADAAAHHQLLRAQPR